MKEKTNMELLVFNLNIIIVIVVVGFAPMFDVIV